MYSKGGHSCKPGLHLYYRNMKIAVPSLLALAIALAVASPIQEPFQVNAWNDTIIDTSTYFVQRLTFACNNRRSHLFYQEPNKLHGRFLHITDMHPDPYYTYRASTSKSCHGKKAKKKSRRANYWGTPTVYVPELFFKLLTGFANRLRG